MPLKQTLKKIAIYLPLILISLFFVVYIQLYPPTDALINELFAKLSIGIFLLSLFMPFLNKTKWYGKVAFVVFIFAFSIFTCVWLISIL